MEKKRIPTRLNWKLGRRIRKYRKIKSLTQAELAEAVKLSTVFIAMIEVGLSRPSFKSLEKIARVLDVKASELLPF